MYYGRSDVFDSVEMSIDIVQNGQIATGDVYPQPQRTGVLWDAYLIKARNHADNARTLCYIASAIYKSIKPKYSYDNKACWNLVSQDEIVLPVASPGATLPDFAFMEEYIRALEDERIRALEDERIRALETYLKVAGFENTELTGEEEKAIAGWQTVAMQEFKIGGEDGLFDIHSPSRRFNANAVQFGGVHPYVVRTSQNNGQRGCIVADEKHLSEGCTISFGQDTATIFYQEKPYFTGDKIKVMKFNRYTLDERNAMFLLTVMRKAFANFKWGSSSFDEKILRDVSVSLPVTSSGEIDFVLIETFIRAVMKKSISSVVAWKDREIAATRKVVDESGGRGATALPSGGRAGARPSREILAAVAEALRFREYLPVYTLRAACGYFGEGEPVEPEGWVKVENCGRLDDKMFVVRAEGRSMEPKIHDGDLCVMRKYEGGSRNGEIVLAQHRDFSDPESGGAYSIKRYSSEKVEEEDGSWHHERITLSPLNREFEPIVIDANEDGEFAVVAVWKGVA